METKLLKYIRKNYLNELPGRMEAMKYFVAANYPLNDNWPNLEEIKILKEQYSKGELEGKYREWEDNSESYIEQFYENNRELVIVTRCPKCNEITIAPSSERCVVCKHTWYGENPHREHS